MEAHNEAGTSEQLLSIDDARRALGVGLTKLNGLVRDGHLPVVWIGGRRRIRRIDFDDYVRSLPAARPDAGQK